MKEFTLPVGELFILGFDGATMPAWLKEFAGRFGLGGVILFDYDIHKQKYERNIFSPDQVKALNAELAQLAARPLVCVDQEGGKVRRLKEKLGFAPLPGAEDFNRLSDGEKRQRIARSFGEMKTLGFHYDLAPVIDMNLNPENPDIGKIGRSYSATADEIRANVAILDEVAREVGLGLCLKHFPGLGSARTNSHLELTDLSEDLTAAETDLFYELGATTFTETILVSHGMVKQWDPELPVSISARAMAPLRKRLPGALLISDDLQMQALQLKHRSMEASERGIRAGLDLLCIGNNLMREEEAMFAVAERFEQLVREDGAFAGRCAEAVGKIRSRKELLGAYIT